MFYQDAVKELQEKTDINSLQEEELVITEPCVCESAAGFYIGKWCLERYGSVLIPQPYDRLSDYMSKERAFAVLSYYQN